MRLFSIFVWVLALGSCGDTPFYKYEIELNESSWPFDETKDFKTDISDTSAVYELQLVVEHKKDYRFENIYFKIYTHFPTLKDREELLNVDLANKAGQWMGNCTGQSCATKVYLLENFKFPEPGSYRFEFEQYTREEKLMGLVSLKLLLYKKEKYDKN